MASDKIITVIVPSYNMEKYLPKCLGSMVVAPELMEKLEVLVVNDGSKDRTSEIAHEFEAKYPHTFKVIDKPNGNYGSCINAALPTASGFYVKVLDADDYVNSINFARLLNLLVVEKNSSTPADLVVSRYVHVDPKGNITPGEHYAFPASVHFDLNDMPKDQMRLMLHMVTYRTRILLDMNYVQTEGVSYTDIEWVLYPMSKIGRVALFDEVVTYYLLGRDGQTMDPVVYSQKYQTVIDLARRFAKKYSECISVATESGGNYFRHQVGKFLQEVYYGYLFGFRGLRVSGDIRKLDDYLQKNCAELDGVVVDFHFNSSRFPYRYVQDWRVWHSRTTPLRVAFISYVWLNKIYRQTIKFVQQAKEKRS